PSRRCCAGRCTGWRRRPWAAGFVRWAFGDANVSTLSSRPMSLTRVEFDELYARHLCRHSQLGIKVVHLAALFGVWDAVYAFLFALTGAVWLPISLAAAYFVAVAVNVPVRVAVATAVFLTAFVAAVVYLPVLPLELLWIYPVLVVAC